MPKTVDYLQITIEAFKKHARTDSRFPHSEDNTAYNFYQLLKSFGVTDRELSKIITDMDLAQPLKFAPFK